MEMNTKNVDFDDGNWREIWYGFTKYKFRTVKKMTEIRDVETCKLIAMYSSSDCCDGVINDYDGVRKVLSRSHDDDHPVT